MEATSSSSTTNVRTSWKKKWRECSSCPTSAGSTHAAKLPWGIGTFWNFSPLGCQGIYCEIFITGFGFFSGGWFRPGERYTHAMVLPGLLEIRVSMSRARLRNSTATFHRFQRGEGATGKTPCFRSSAKYTAPVLTCYVGTRHASHN